MPDSCCHVFCLGCLLTWAEVRLRFFFFLQTISLSFSHFGMFFLVILSCRRLPPAPWTEDLSAASADGTETSGLSRSVCL